MTQLTASHSPGRSCPADHAALMIKATTAAKKSTILPFTRERDSVCFIHKYEIEGLELACLIVDGVD
jgi:hypothetical protein